MSDISKAKIEKPHAHFETPQEVIADPTLSE